MIILRLHILHALIKMIRHVLIEMILNKMRKPRKTNNDDEYKEDNYQHQHGNERVL